MFSRKPPQQKQIKPILFPGPFLLQKSQKDSPFEGLNEHNACLLKYFPRYCRNLDISLDTYPIPTQHKIRLVKVIQNFHCTYIPEFQEETLKRLLRTNRKTLKSLPTYEGNHSNHDQRHSLSLYFPNITTLDLSYNQCFKGDHHLGVLTRSLEKDFYRSYGYFWDSNRFVKKLKVTNQDLYYWVMLKKLGESKRFLKSLKTLQLTVNQFSERSMVRRSLVELLKNKEVLEHVADLKFCNSGELIYFWQLIESIINSCHKLSRLSLPVHLTAAQFESGLESNFSLNFSRLDYLRVLELRTNCLTTWISGIEFPQSLQKIILETTDCTNMSGLLEIFGSADGRSRLSLDRYKIQQNFSDKWKKLQSLKVLKLILPIFAEPDHIFKRFIVPLLKAIPQLEAFTSKWLLTSTNDQSPLDLDILLEGIDPLRSLKKLKISSVSGYLKLRLLVTYNPRKVYFLPQITSIKIDAAISSDFELRKFLNTLFFNVKSKVYDGINKSVKLSRLRISCLKQFSKILHSLYVISELKTAEFEMEIDLVEQTLSSLIEDFRYPIYIANNLLLKVEIKLIDSEIPISLTEEEKQHLSAVLSQVDFTVSYTQKTKTISGNYYWSNKRVLLNSPRISR